MIAEGEEDLVFQPNEQTQSNEGLVPAAVFMKKKELLNMATLQNIEKIVPIDAKNGYAFLVAYIFGTYDKIEALNRICQLMPKGLCAGAIEGHVQSYKCDDCGRETNYHIYCNKCFESGFQKGMHKGHRYKAKTNRSGCCDCGDINAIEPSGFCPVHTGSTTCDVNLDPDIEKRLQEALVVCFTVLFQLCERKLRCLNILNPLPEVDSGESGEQIENIILVVSSFVGEFCNNKLPLQFAVSRIFLSALNRQLQHTCKKEDFQSTFRTPTKHLCQESIVALLFKYSIVLDNQQKLIAKTLYSMFVSEEYKLRLSQIFLECFGFMVVFLMAKNYPFMMVLRIHQVYCQFFGDKYTNHIINSKAFHNVTKQLAFALDKVNQHYFAETYKAAFDVIQMFYRLHGVCEQEKQETLSLKLIGQLLNLSYITVQNKGISYNHHKIKTVMEYILLEVVHKLSSVILFEQPHVQEHFFQLVQSYFLNSEIEEDRKEVEFDEEEETIQFGWYCLPELCVGTLIVSHYNRFGKEETRKMLEGMGSAVKHGPVSKFILKIVTAQVDAFRISQSQDVGFPGEFPPKDLYRYFYKNPQKSIYDTTISVLQVMALLFPQHFLDAIQNFVFEFSVPLLIDVLTEESCFINLSSRMKSESRLFKTGLKIQFINFINLKGKATFADLKSSFLEHMFTESLSLNETLQEVAVYDAKAETYSIKPEYKDLQESILIKRADAVFGRMFEQEDPEAKLFKKDSLFRRQQNEAWSTLCQLTTVELGGLTGFPTFFETLLLWIWNSNASMKRYEYTKLLEVILLRNTKDQKLHILKDRILKEKAQTPIQHLVLSILDTISKQAPEAPSLTNDKQGNPRNKTMQAHIEKMKKQQAQFIHNNLELYKEVQESHTQQVDITEEIVCLICQQGETLNEHPGFLLLCKPIEINGTEYDIYFSCGHVFHKKCVNKQSSALCPVCKHPFNNLFPLPPRNRIHMLSPHTSSNISCQLKEPLRFIVAEGAIDIMEMIHTRVYLSILESCTRFVQRDLLQLRVLFCKAVCYDKLDVLGLMGNEEEVLKAEKARTVTPDNRVHCYLNLLKLMFVLALDKDSFKTKKLFEQVISVVFTRFLACNFLCFMDAEELKDGVEAKFKQYEDALKAQMNQFCKGVIFAYSVLFEDQRNRVLQTITNEDHIASTLIERYPEFFNLDNSLFISEVVANKDHPMYLNKAHQSLAPIPSVISLPQNYMEFHSQYNDLKCDECKGILQVYKDQSWMCMLCGYKACLVNCSQLPINPCASLYKHFIEHHMREGLAVDLNSSQVLIMINTKSYEFGFLYENRFGESDSDEIKDWRSLRLQGGRWNKLLEILRKRTLAVYVGQNSLKGKILGM